MDSTQGKSEGARAVNISQAYDQVARNQEAKVPEIHSVAANLATGHQPTQGVMFVPGPSFFTNHEDISKFVQKILQPKVFDHPNWNPPSAEYTNKPINCQICKITITDIDSLLICDACEKGTHLKCLQSYGNKDGMPKAEWHCPRCLTTNSGKPFPPKYGRVTRTIVPPKGTSNTVATSAASEIKPENLASKVSQHRPVANGGSDPPHLVHHSTSATHSIMLTQDSKTDCPVDSQSRTKKEDEISLIASSKSSTEQDGLASATFSTDKDLKSSGSLACTGTSTFESISNQKVESKESSPENQQDTVDDNIDQSHDPNESNEVKVLISMSSANQQEESIGLSNEESQEPSESHGESQHNSGCDVRLDDQGNEHAVSNGKPNIDESEGSEPLELKEASERETTNNRMPDSSIKCELISNGAIDNDGSRGSSNHSVPESDAVHWLDDIVQVVDGKTYYQSCRINGVVYKLQNHALVASSSQNFIPSKILVRFY